jgi:hypothetical protein
VLYEAPEHHTSLSGRTPIEHQHIDALITGLAAFSAILTETMVRGQSVAWIGRRLERTLGALCPPFALLGDPSAAGPGGLINYRCVTQPRQPSRTRPGQPKRPFPPLCRPSNQRSARPTQPYRLQNRVDRPILRSLAS